MLSIRTVKLGSRAFSTSPVQVDYNLVKDQRKELYDLIEEAYNDDGLGVMVINNIPTFKEKREALLPLAQKVASLKDSQKKELETPEWHYSVGWSHGKEKFEGKPDYFKGSYYANPLEEEWESHKDESGNRVQQHNIWPTNSVPELERCFKDLGSLIKHVALDVSHNLDLFIKAQEPAYETGKIHRMLAGSDKQLGRLLHYFPQKGKGSNADWCGWHNDHSLLTGLVSAMYLDSNGKEIMPDQIETGRSGLFAMNRRQEICQIKIPRDSLAFQIGETAQIVSGGLLKATPHSVMSSPLGEGISRNTFACFFSPKFDEPLIAPTEAMEGRVFKDNRDVPGLEGRWEPGITFEGFEANTFKQYYEF